jgi:hypothetical protein
MAALIFETREAVLTLEQNGDQDDVSVISLQLTLTNRPTVYISGGELLKPSRWSMTIRADDTAVEAGWISYVDLDGKPECGLVINQSQSRFDNVLDMFKGGHVSEISVDVDGMTQKDDYSSQWDTDTSPTLTVTRASFEFPLPQSEA